MSRGREVRSGRRRSRRGAGATGSSTERRDELLDAAVEAIREHGPGASMEQIASAAGVTKPILYRHVGGRDAFVAALTDRFVADLTQRLRETFARAQDDDPRAVLAAAIDAYLELVERDTALYRFLIRRVGGEPGAAEVLARVIRQIAEIQVVEIGERLRALGADSGAAEPWAYGLVGMVHAAGDWWLEHRTMPRHRLVEYLVALVWEGMGVAALGAATGSARASRDS